MRRTRYVVFRALPSLVALVVMGVAFYWHMVWSNPFGRGQDLNRMAWEATFRERGEVPPNGPREGYWGSRINQYAKHQDYAVRWFQKDIHSPGLFDIDENGEQHWGSGGMRIVIVGASVAQGAYASCIDRTYFAVLGRELEAKVLSVTLDIVSTGGWKSSQELAALRWYLKRQKPKLVVMLNGLNDLTLGATAQSLFNETIQLHDGRIVAHTQDYEARRDAYLSNMQQAAELARGVGAEFLVVLQPSLLEKKSWTMIEEKLARDTLQTLMLGEQIPFFYDTMRHGLGDMKIRYIDTSRLFDGEKATTFTDIWHFADSGHEILGKAMAGEVSKLLIGK